jgi:hypothetical protein
MDLFPLVNQSIVDDVSKKVTIFLTSEYTYVGHKTIIVPPNELAGSTVTFSGILTNSNGVAVQTTVDIVDYTPTSCSTQQLKEFEDNLNTLLGQFENVLDIATVINTKSAIDMAFYSSAWTNCGNQLANLTNAQYQETAITTTDCVADPSSQEYQEDSCCSDIPAWGSVCRPRVVTTVSQSYSLDSAALETCGSPKCTQSFLQDYIDRPIYQCQELSDAYNSYLIDKSIRIHKTLRSVTQ